jgi:hypothetical protein
VIFPHQSTAGWSPQLGITGVIDYFLAQTDSRAGLSRSIIENRCRHALERYPDALSDFEDKWRDLVKPLFLKRLQVSTERRLFADAGGIFNDFAAYIERDFRTSLMRCLESALSTGFLIDEPSQGAFRPARDVPVIWFDCESADDALASIQAWLLTQDSEQTELSFDYEEALRELRTIQHSEYFFFLTFAVLFAANGRWKMTSMLTHRAIDVASTVASSGAAGAEWIPPAVHGKTGKPRRAVMTPVSGREAYYACSIATRVTARSVSDFDKAARLLDKAYEALESDRQRLEADGEADYLKILTTVRFDVEKLAHQVALFLFTRFKPTNTAVELLTRDDFLRRTQELLRCVSEEPSGLQEGLRRRLLVNLFSRYLHDEQWRSESSSGGSLVDELRTLLAQLGEVVAHDEAPATGFSLRTSYLLRAVWITARSVLDATPSRSGRREMEGEALTLFARGEMSRNATAVYDRERFSELADICFWQLGSRRPLAH